VAAPARPSPALHVHTPQHPMPNVSHWGMVAPEHRPLWGRVCFLGGFPLPPALTCTCTWKLGSLTAGMNRASRNQGRGRAGGPVAGCRQSPAPGARRPAPGARRHRNPPVGVQQAAHEPLDVAHVVALEGRERCARVFQRGGLACGRGAGRRASAPPPQAGACRGGQCSAHAAAHSEHLHAGAGTRPWSHSRGCWGCWSAPGALVGRVGSGRTL
jgi:hypothetical protein